MSISERIVARWEARGGKRFVELYHDGRCYCYRMERDMGVGYSFKNDQEAIEAMEAPWGPHVGPVTVLKEDFPTTKRII